LVLASKHHMKNKMYLCFTCCYLSNMFVYYSTSHQS